MYGSILVAMSLIAQVSDKPRVKYDKFDDVTVISTVLGKIPGSDAKKSEVMLIASHEGKDPKKFTDAQLLIIFSRSDESFAWKEDIASRGQI